MGWGGGRREVTGVADGVDLEEPVRLGLAAVDQAIEALEDLMDVLCQPVWLKACRQPCVILQVQVQHDRPRFPVCVCVCVRERESERE